MRLDGFDLNLLAALERLLSERSVTRAAERLCMSQSAMSSALVRLREHFGDELLVKSAGRMVLTPLAHSLAEPLHEALTRLRRHVLQAPQFEPATSTRAFSLTMVDGSATLLMPQVLARAATEAPGVTLQVQLHHPHAIDELTRGDIDLLVVPQAFTSPEHPSQVLLSADHVCAVWAGSSKYGDALSLDDYLGAGHVVVRFGKSQRLLSYEEWAVAQSGRTGDATITHRRIEVLAPTFDAAARFVVGTHRLVTLPRRLAELYQAALPLKLLELPWPLPPMALALQWHRSRMHDGGTQWLLGLFQAAVSDSPPDNA